MTPTTETTTTPDPRPDSTRTVTKRAGISGETKFMIAALLVIILGGGAMFGLSKISDPPRNDPPKPPEGMSADKVDALFNKSRHQKGNADAKLTFVEFADFQCPSCRRAYSKSVVNMEKSLPSYRMAFLNLPLPMHERAIPAAVAAEAAAKQGKFWEMYAALFSKERESLSDSDFTNAAKAIGLDPVKFATDVKNAKPLRDLASADVEIANANDVQSTPTFFIHDKEGNTAVLAGAANFERIYPDLKDGIVGNDKIEPKEPDGVSITLYLKGKRELR